MTSKKEKLYTEEEFAAACDKMHKQLEENFNKKSKPFLNEIQLQLNHHSELIERAHYFKQLNYTQYIMYKNMFETFKDSADSYLNDVRGVKND